MEITLSGRTAIVTGGSKGIGLGIAASFVQSGASVAIVARGQAGLDQAVKALGMAGPGRVIAVAADVARAEDVIAAYGQVIRQFGSVDIVVNNAGTSRAGPFEDLSDERMQEDLDQKLFAAIRLTRLAWPQMKERRWGRVINILSIAAKTPQPGSAPTAISRAAGMALTKILAGEGAAHNILVNALLVGVIEADQHAHHARAAGLSLADHMANITRSTPLGRAGKPEEIAALACLLASDAGSFISGAAINVDGGSSPSV